MISDFHFLKNRLPKWVKSRTIRWGVLASLVLLLCAGALAIQIEHWIVRSRTVKQSQVAEGWKAAGLEITERSVKHKENFWKMAREYHVDIDTIVGANRDLKKLQAALGQMIRIPNQRGVLHRTDGVDSVRTLSSLYAVSEAAIMTMNNLREKHILPPGVELFIPGARPVQLTEEMSASYGLRGIFVSHKDSFTTIYGHCSQTLVKKGQRIKKGQVIARVGNTGRTTGSHLHFEIRKNGIPQDPLKYLW